MVTHKTELTFAARLHYLLVVLDWDDSKLAKKAGISPVSVNRFLCKEIYPRYKTLRNICIATGCNCEFLLGLTDYLCFKNYKTSVK